MSASIDRILFPYGGSKRHVGFYPTSIAIEKSEAELESYETNRSTIKFPFDEPLPTDLVTEIATSRVTDVKENDAKWL